MAATPLHLSSLVKSHAQALGFDLVGISAATTSPYADHIRAWIASGQHGEMDYLDAGLEVRLDIRRKLPWAKSVISVALAYYAPNPHPEIQPPREAPEIPPGKIARYAWGRDYHAIFTPRLKKLERTLRDALPPESTRFEARAYCDAGPLLEREFAARAGLGWIGKHTLLIHPRHGSYFLLGELVTSLELAPDEPLTDHCGTCTRCIDACPTHAITPYSVNGSKCISYLTIEHKSAIDPTLVAPLHDAGYLIGCDICQEVCPFNRAPLLAHEPGFAPRAPAPAVDPQQVRHWTAQDWEMATIGGAHRRVKLPLWKRNAGLLENYPL